MPYDAIVTAAHRTQYPKPISFKAGEKVRVGKRDDEYPGWIWTTVASGDSAWAPEELLTVSGTEAVALVDYESTELNTEAGLRVDRAQHGSGRVRACPLRDARVGLGEELVRQRGLGAPQDAATPVLTWPGVSALAKRALCPSKRRSE